MLNIDVREHASAVRAKPVWTTHRKVLVADDSRDSAESLAILLTLEGHEVRWVCDGAESWRCFNEFQPSAAILDLSMPLMSGHELARRIRRYELRPTLLIALSGWTREADRARSLAAGFDHHVAKPAEYDVLQRLLCD